VASINVSGGGVPKRPIASAAVTAEGVEGDRQRHTDIHGGPERAVCLFSLERIAALRGEGHPIAPGTTGENLTLAGLDWDAVRPGRRLQAGTLRLEVTAYAEPCVTIRDSFRDGAVSCIAQARHPGWSRVYARVLEPGRVAVGDPVALLST
jgi:MOSC domain-containing protein YiiM